MVIYLIMEKLNAPTSEQSDLVRFIGSYEQILFTVTMDAPIDTIGSLLRSDAFVIESTGRMKTTITNGVISLYKASRQRVPVNELQIQTESERSD